MISRRQLRIKVVRALYAHLKSESESLAVSEKLLSESIARHEDLYFHLLRLWVEVTLYAAERQEIARRKKLPTPEDLNPNTRFVDNAPARMIAGNEPIAARLKERKLGWAAYPELVRALYNRLVEAPYYKEYMEAADGSFEDDVRLMCLFYEKELQECDLLDETLEEQSSLWTDDLGATLMLIIRTLQRIKPASGPEKWVPEFKNREDRAFVRTLFERTLVEYGERAALVERFARNWDVERIAFMDFLILATAVTELIECPEIPVKVTLDEYIDIAKRYSTPGSHQFINGLLDRIAAELTADGRIAKTGKGLL